MELQVSAFLASLEASLACSRSTRLAYASDLRVFLDFLQKTLQRPPNITDLDATKVVDFLQAEARAGRKPSTLSRRLATLRKFNLFLAQEGIIPGIPLISDSRFAGQQVQFPTPRVDLSFLSCDQVEKLFYRIGTIPNPRALRDQALFKLFVEIGLSVGSVVALDLTDLDLRTRQIHLITPYGKDVWVPLFQAHPVVKRYVEEGRPDLNHRWDEPALFISQLDRRLSRQGIWQIVQTWGRLLDPPLKISPRRLRHTAIIKMVQSGRSCSEIQAILGHRNPISTQALIRRLQTAEAKTVQEYQPKGGRNN